MLQKQHEQNIKDIHDRYNKGVEKIQSSHEEITHDLVYQHEGEMEVLRDELKRCKGKCSELQKEKNTLLGKIDTLNNQIQKLKTVAKLSEGAGDQVHITGFFHIVAVVLI